MKMTCKITFDPLQVAPKDVATALKALNLDEGAITFHNSRETSEPKPKPAAASSR